MKKNKLNIKTNWDKNINLSENELKTVKGGNTTNGSAYTCASDCMSCPPTIIYCPDPSNFSECGIKK
ncbi:hypothetical protein BKI52_03650 [marine bacterium AO1-C]|nr:hypothetical protein BKI52_03650 [marine bacterium AO1-C]